MRIKMLTSQLIYKQFKLIRCRRWYRLILVIMQHYGSETIGHARN